ncbi:hsp70-Hsp90 organizing protein [Cynoglossus semilaevis]|uniref:hsp70-Hsp90 organizing protein n=1 Tax=Cynoglossus semilaevis TaxID=244447 RepID=UPI000D630465|nr:hsp70-Hsp90 organizing protein-like [Cynoglossus semilaevis]
MKFTRDICRLLGLASGPPVQQPEEQMDCDGATPKPSHDASLSQDALNGEEDLSEEEKVRRKAERRKAKKKRRRKRKKQEQVKQSETAEQDEDDEDVGAESELDESESEPEVEAALIFSKEPEWDVSSAFFANAASHIKPKQTSRKSRENKENEAKRETNGTDIVTKKSTSLTEKGIKLVQEGQYAQAVIMFTEAIRCDPKDNRFFGNRSYCYYCLEQYPPALADAERAIQLAPDWPKGYFRKGSALMGMKRYSEAETAMEQVLKLDKDCEEAVTDLFNCKVLQLMELGFEELQSVQLLEKFSTVQAVQTACLEAARAGNQDPSVVQPGSPCASLWVGNVTTELTEKHLWDLFKMYGEIESIRVLHERFCAFEHGVSCYGETKWLLHREHASSGEVSRPAHSEGSPCSTQDLSLCNTAGRSSCWTSKTGACKRRRMLLLENHWLPLRGQMPLQTHSGSEKQRQETLAALTSSLPVLVYSENRDTQTELQELVLNGPG